MVTHDVFSACYCERILFLCDGKIYAELERGTVYCGNDAGDLYVGFHSDCSGRYGLADPLYDAIYSGKKKPGICDLFVGGNAEKTAGEIVCEGKSFSRSGRFRNGSTFGRRLAFCTVFCVL